MLAEPTKEEVEKYLDFAYGLALDPARSGYPTYTDGIKTREDFEEAAWKGFYNDHRKILLFESNGRVEGWIQFTFLPEDHYLQTEIFNIASGTEQALSEFEAYCKENYSGADLYFGFPKDNAAAVNYLSRNGWTCIERSYNDVLHFETYHPMEDCATVVPVTRDNYRDFQSLHQPIEGDMYWNSQRLYADLDNWTIWLAYRGKTPAAAIYYTNESILTEIFGVDFAGNRFEETIFRLLLIKALNDCKEKGCRHMVFFNDEESQRAALACGFTCVGEYVCYMKKG